MIRKEPRLNRWSIPLIILWMFEIWALSFVINLNFEL
jgi:hypothetical protein